VCFSARTVRDAESSVFIAAAKFNRSDRNADDVDEAEWGETEGAVPMRRRTPGGHSARRTVGFKVTKA
jgi:hypothetical protein